MRAAGAEIELSGASIGWITFEGEDCYLNADEKSVMNAVGGEYTDGPAPIPFDQETDPTQAGGTGTGTDTGTGTGTGTGSGSGTGTGSGSGSGSGTGTGGGVDSGGWTPYF